MHYQNKLKKDTRIIGVLGHPIKQSYSPLMHNIAFELEGLDYIYLPFDVPTSNLKAALKGMIALGIKGMNVTVPHKEKVIDYLQDVSEEASIVGAVNTIVNENGVLQGYNTDVNGVLETLLPYKEKIADQDVAIIGAGGASRSVVFTLIRHFKVNKIILLNRTEQKAESLKEYFAARMMFDEFKVYELVPPDIIEVLRDSKLIINTTSMGMYPDMDDSATTIADSFSKDQIIFDVIYNPIKTKFLQIAESQGAEVIGGLKMFVEQGAKAYELWTGKVMPKDKIFKTLQAYLST
ncbi:MAG: shikimate dehydrogenase [Ignavibacteria bacterium]|jgi:shikimate dehydrogenase